ncbi:ABC transporter related protein, partial [mine drainage metagenome]
MLRNGQVVGILQRSEFTRTRLVRLMSGVAEVRKPQDAERAAAMPTPAITGSSPHHGVVLRLRSVVITANAPTVDLDIRAGQVTGLAGLEGHGQALLLKYLSGVERPWRGAAEIPMPDGTYERLRSYRHAVTRGVVYVPRDRKSEGMFPTLSVLENFGMPTMAKRS